MNIHHKSKIVLFICLLILTMACEISIFPTAPEGVLSADEAAMTDQADLQTAVAQTVEALGPVEKATDTASAETELEDESSAGAPTDTPLPCNKPNFQDETIPDDTKFDPGEQFTKKWTIQNDGTCSWTTNYSLVFNDGDKMGGPDSKAFTSTTNPGETVTLSVDLTAPLSSGTYTGAWKIRAEDGEEFGNYWITIRVGEDEEEENSNFAVTGVSFTQSDQMKVGFCPHMFNLQAEITVNGKGIVKYHWIISNGFESTVETISFDSAGTKTAILNKNLSCSGTSTCSYVVELYIDSPNHQKFGTWVIAIHCI